MTITARFPSRCAKCGGPIRTGEQIEWTKGSPPRHTKCAGGAQKTSAAKPAPPAPVPAGSVTLTFGRRVDVGQAVTNKTGDVLIVHSVKYYPPNEDNDDFDPQWRAVCRPATETEAAPVIARRQAQAAQDAARRRLEAIADGIRHIDNHVTDTAAATTPEVENVERFNVRLNTIITLGYNGYGISVHERTYDDSHCWRVPYEPALAAEIRRLAAIVNPAT